MQFVMSTRLVYRLVVCDEQMVLINQINLKTSKTSKAMIVRTIFQVPISTWVVGYLKNYLTLLYQMYENNEGSYLYIQYLMAYTTSFQTFWISGSCYYKNKLTAPVWRNKHVIINNRNLFVFVVFFLYKLNY